MGMYEFKWRLTQFEVKSVSSSTAPLCIWLLTFRCSIRLLLALLFRPRALPPHKLRSREAHALLLGDTRRRREVAVPAQSEACVVWVNGVQDARVPGAVSRVD